MINSFQNEFPREYVFWGLEIIILYSSKLNNFSEYAYLQQQFFYDICRRNVMLCFYCKVLLITISLNQWPRYVNTLSYTWHNIKMSLWEPLIRWKCNAQGNIILKCHVRTIKNKININTQVFSKTKHLFLFY